VGWRPRANVSGTHVRPGSFSTTFRTNSRGLRSPERPLSKPPGVKRIVVLGDSFAWGYGVEDREIFTEVLEAALPGYQVINLGVTAFATRQEFQFLKLEGLAWEPDVVLLAFTLNDILESVTAPRSAAAPAPNRGLKRALANHSAFYRFAVDRLHTNRTLVRLLVNLGVTDRLSGPEELDPNLAPALKVYPDHLQRAFERARGDLLEMHRFLQARGIRFLVALIPSLQSVDATAFRHTIAYSIYDVDAFDLDKPYRLLGDVGRALGIDVVNPVEAFRREHRQGTARYLRNDMHFSPVGHALFAREIHATLAPAAAREGRSLVTGQHDRSESAPVRP
jgi:lysophospholipase L1-like esterase